MADRKISELTNITGANIADGDELVVVDTSASETKAITFGEFKNALDTSTGFVSITGDTMTGDLTVPNVIVSGNVDGRDVSSDGTKLDTVETNADVTDTANVTAAGALMDSELTSEASVKALDQGVATTDSPTFAGLTTTADVSFGDNDKAIFGAGSDLQIYHDGSNSFIDDQGTGSLNYRAANRHQFLNEDGSKTYMQLVGDIVGQEFVQLRYNNTTRLATTSTGVDITGTLTSDGLTVDGNITLQKNNPVITISDTGTTNQQSFIRQLSGTLYFDGQSGATTDGSFLFRGYDGSTNKMLISYNGDISFYEDTGTTAKMVWKAADERLGIGTSSPSEVLHVTGGADPSINITGTSGTATIKSTDRDLKYDARFGTHVWVSNGSTERMRIDSSGNVGIGTNSPTSKLEVNVDGTSAITVRSSDGGQANLIFGDQTDADRGRVVYSNADESMRFAVNNLVEAMRITSDGSVGIGTTSPSGPLHVVDGRDELSFTNGSNNVYLSLTAGFNTKNSVINFYNTSDAGYGRIDYDHATEYMAFSTNSAEAMRISSGGKVIINGTVEGSTGYADTLTVSNTAGNGGMTIRSANTSLGSIFFSDVNANSGSGAYAGFLQYSHAVNAMLLGTSSTERMRIDSSGNLLVNQTATGDYTTTVGSSFRASGFSTHTADANAVLLLNRLTSNGDIALFRKDNATAGVIGSELYNSDLYIGNSDTGVIFQDANDAIQPFNPSTNGFRDAAINLGFSTTRFKDLYLSGGVYLGGTGSANKLDDYEEGTCTISLDGATGSFTATYVKVGTLVQLSVALSWTGTPSSDNLSGLPFTPKNDAFASVDVMNSGNYSSGYRPVIRVRTGDFRILKSNGNTHSASLTSEIPTTITFTITYQTNS